MSPSDLHLNQHRQNQNKEMASKDLTAIQVSSGHSKAESFTILYFASAADYAGVPSESLPAPLSLSNLFSLLESRYPGITAKVLDSCAVTVNLEYVDLEESGRISDGSEFMIRPRDEVGIIPPVSSG